MASSNTDLSNINAFQQPLSLQKAQQLLQSWLVSLYAEREAANIADWVLENITGKKKIDRIIYKNEPLSTEEARRFEQYAAALRSGLPVQYVLHESWFAGLHLYVDESVLIPRPETEELVEWIVEDWSVAPSTPPSILDVGTGSGCIALSLRYRLPKASVTACDLSEKALAVARRNAADLSLPVNFQQLDFLDPGQWPLLPSVNVLVSNPPYIPLSDKPSMIPQVVDHEPHMALFVTNEDPLVFYRALAQFGNDHLLPGGTIYAEIHEELAASVTALFNEAGYGQVTVKKDLQGKERMVKAGK